MIIDSAAIRKADEAYREICVTQGIQYAYFQADRDVLLCAVVRVYFENANFGNFTTTGGDHVRGYKV